jgi:hypothetical protein
MTRIPILLSLESKTIFHFSAYSRLLKSIAFTMLVAGLTAAQAPAGLKRPQAVPADFVITPFGYFHPSCVKHLANGDEIRHETKVVVHKDGTSSPVTECAYPHFRADGEEVVGEERGATDPNISHAWIEFASIHSTATSPPVEYGQIYSEWEVPPNPTTNDGQVVYLFNGFEDILDVVTIIQPVLGWNSDYAGAWGIAAWNCCLSGDTWEAAPAHVNPGDRLEGYVFNNCASGTKTCGSWDIVIIDDQNGNSSFLTDVPNHGQTFNWAFGGVLEVYGITQCSDYPPPDYAGGIGFHNQSVLNNKFLPITPSWTVTNWSAGLTPQCNYGGSTPKQIVLTY